MKIQSIMTKDVATCGPHTDLAAVATLMWQRDCGIVPVVGEAGSVVGVITDRDICIALGTRNQKPTDVLVKDVMLPKQYTFRSFSLAHPMTIFTAFSRPCE